MDIGTLKKIIGNLPDDSTIKIWAQNKQTASMTIEFDNDMVEILNLDFDIENEEYFK